MPLRLLIRVLLVVLAGCSGQPASVSTTPVQPIPFPSGRPAPVVGSLHEAIREDLERYVGARQRHVVQSLADVSSVGAAWPHPIVLGVLKDPWQGMRRLEEQGHKLAELAGFGPDTLANILDVLQQPDHSPEPFTPIPPPAGHDGEEHVRYVMAVLEQAHLFRQKALHRLSRDDQEFLFQHARTIVERFTPHTSRLDDSARAHLHASFRFARLVNEEMDRHALAAAAEVLARLADRQWLRELEGISRGPLTLAAAPVGGVTGDVLLVRETPHGLIVIGGPGPNVYELDGRFAVVLDLGGEDVYRGAIAAGTDPAHGISVVIDLSGNDTYEASPLGLATGRVGVGLLIDRKGDDVYRLPEGAGGTGFAGIGVLYDGEGDDEYVGSTFTQGAAVAGLGLLVDLAGNDTHTSVAYAIGFGGPAGIGAVLDVAGSDRYQCGGQSPSEYNAVEAPGLKPHDQNFQYDAFGIGMGSGTRIFTDSAERSYSLAGGMGFMIDGGGDDEYRSSNFSQGTGYFFGAGVKLDLGGRDVHAAARYGHGAAAHSGVGLFIDAVGEDRYTSTGPVYNGGAAWDRSAALFIDAGTGNDRYDFHRSDGLGRADHQSWSLAIEEAGQDRYRLPKGMGRAIDDSVSGFFDLAGEDEYPDGTQPGRGNGKTFVEDAGSVFVDR